MEMLQLSGTLRNASSRLTPISWRMPTQQLIAACSSRHNPSPVPVQAKEQEASLTNHAVQGKKVRTLKNTTIREALNTLKVTQRDAQSSSAPVSERAPQMGQSASVDGLLNTVNAKTITPQKAHAMVTLLLDWVNNGKARLSDFELDERFLYLCNLISESNCKEVLDTPKVESKNTRYTDEFDLSHGIDEISRTAKDVENMTVSQMIRVMTALSRQKRRITPLLRVLALNISESTEVLNIKQLSDLLYSMAVLNYPEEVLLQKASADLMPCIRQCKNSAVIGSILTSLGMLRYKNDTLMNELSQWVAENSPKTRQQDVCSFFLTLAMIGYTPPNTDNLHKVYAESLNMLRETIPGEWLNVVWALTVLRMAKSQQIASVLDRKFLARLAESKGISVPQKQKLLNINGAAQLLMTDYNGPLLEHDSEIFTCPIERSKEKQIFVQSVLSAAKVIFPVPEYLNLDVDFGMGFLLDAEFCIESTGGRLPINSNVENCKGLRVAVVSLCYNDFCRGQQVPVGFYDLNFRILRAKGYHILTIPHTEFSTEDNIVERTLYVKNRIKNIIAT